MQSIWITTHNKNFSINSQLFDFQCICFLLNTIFFFISFCSRAFLFDCQHWYFLLLFFSLEVHEGDLESVDEMCIVWLEICNYFLEEKSEVYVNNCVKSSSFHIAEREAKERKLTNSWHPDEESMSVRWKYCEPKISASETIWPITIDTFHNCKYYGQLFWGDHK